MRCVKLTSKILSLSPYDVVCYCFLLLLKPVLKNESNEAIPIAVNNQGGLLLPKRLYFYQKETSAKGVDLRMCVRAHLPAFPQAHVQVETVLSWRRPLLGKKALPYQLPVGGWLYGCLLAFLSVCKLVL